MKYPETSLKYPETSLLQEKGAKGQLREVHGVTRGVKEGTGILFQAI
jgi:hypothetical protein